MVIIIKVEDKELGCTFRSFYGRWQKVNAENHVKLLAEKGVKAEIINEK